MAFPSLANTSEKVTGWRIASRRVLNYCKKFYPRTRQQCARILAFYPQYPRLTRVHAHPHGIRTSVYIIMESTGTVQNLQNWRIGTNALRAGLSCTCVRCVIDHVIDRPVSRRHAEASILGSVLTFCYIYVNNTSYNVTYSFSSRRLWLIFYCSYYTCGWNDNICASRTR